MLLWPEKSSASFYWPLAAAAAPPIMPATSRRLAACSSRGLLAVTLALLSGGFQLAVAFRVDFLLTPRQHILRRDVADGTVQADVVVMLDVSLHQAQRIVQRERCSGPDTLALQRLVPTLDFPIRLGIIGRGSDVRHARDANELFEVASDELRPVVRDDPRLRHRVLLLGAFENYFDIRFPHGLTQVPMHEETTEPVQNAAQVIEGAAQVDVGNVDMPVLMRLQRLLETGSLARGSSLPP